MTLKKIEKQQRQLEKTVKSIHPDNPLSFHITRRYRELEQLKTQIA